jgi:hypothetical protein
VVLRLHLANFRRHAISALLRALVEQSWLRVRDELDGQLVSAMVRE